MQLVYSSDNIPQERESERDETVFSVSSSSHYPQLTWLCVCEWIPMRMGLSLSESRWMRSFDAWQVTRKMFAKQDKSSNGEQVIKRSAKNVRSPELRVWNGFHLHLLLLRPPPPPLARENFVHLSQDLNHLYLCTEGKTNEYCSRESKVR